MIVLTLQKHHVVPCRVMLCCALPAAAPPQQGLEVEVQRLIARHRSELEAAHDRAGEQVKAALEGQQAEQELKMQALKDKLRQVRMRLLLVLLSRQQTLSACGSITVCSVSSVGTCL